MNISPVKNSISRVLQDPFSESDALYLQDIFLTPGVHHVYVDSTSKARSVISKVLKSLQYHQKAAYLSLQNLDLLDDMCDIMRLLIADDYLVNHESLILFFLEDFYFDFLLIEETQELVESIWYEQFKQYLVDFNFHKSIPIIKVHIK